MKYKGYKISYYGKEIVYYGEGNNFWEVYNRVKSFYNEDPFKGSNIYVITLKNKIYFVFLIPYRQKIVDKLKNKTIKEAKEYMNFLLETYNN